MNLGDKNDNILSLADGNSDDYPPHLLLEMEEGESEGYWIDYSNHDFDRHSL